MHLSEPLLFHKILKNTGILLPGTIISFASYLEESIDSTQGTDIKMLLHRISESLRILPKEEKVWCLTNSMRNGGAMGLYQLSLLNKFCREQKFSKILIGVGNRDYGYIIKDSPENQKHIAYLLDFASDFMANNGTLKETYLFTYNNETNRLTRIS